jgi:hypothetical protein
MQNVKHCKFHENVREFHIAIEHLLALNWFKFDGIVRQGAPLYLVKIEATQKSLHHQNFLGYLPEIEFWRGYVKNQFFSHLLKYTSSIEIVLSNAC